MSKQMKKIPLPPKRKVDEHAIEKTIQKVISVEDEVGSGIEFENDNQPSNSSQQMETKKSPWNKNPSPKKIKIDVESAEPQDIEKFLDKGITCSLGAKFVATMYFQKGQIDFKPVRTVYTKNGIEYEEVSHWRTIEIRMEEFAQFVKGVNNMMDVYSKKFGK